MSSDQAEQLRRIVSGRPSAQRPETGESTRTFVVGSGRGGVGKSVFSIELAHRLSMAGERVLLIDGDVRGPSLHVLMNTLPDTGIRQLLSPATAPAHISPVPISSHLHLLANSGYSTTGTDPVYQVSLFANSLQQVTAEYDTLIIDTSCGIDRWNLGLIQLSDYLVMLSLVDPTSVIDTYTMIKSVLPYVSASQISVVMNQTISHDSGIETMKKLNMALEHFLGSTIALAGTILFDPALREAVTRQEKFWETTGVYGDCMSKIYHLLSKKRTLITSRSAGN